MQNNKSGSIGIVISFLSSEDLNYVKFILFRLKNCLNHKMQQINFDTSITTNLVKLLKRINDEICIVNKALKNKLNYSSNKATIF